MRPRCSRYHDPNVRDFFRTPHSDYLQALCDGGVLVGLPLLATLGVLAVRVARGAPNPLNSRSFDKWTRYGAAVGLTAVACQELVDFGLQTPANAVLFAVLAAYAAGPRPASTSKRGVDGNERRPHGPLGHLAPNEDAPRQEARRFDAGFFQRSVFLTAALVCTASPAFAQDSDPTATARMHFGPLALTPTIGLTNLGVDTNVFNDSEDASPKQDFTLTVEPKVDLWMHFGRSLLSGTVTPEFVYYQTYSTERSVNGFYRAGALVPLNRLTLDGDVTYLNTRDPPGYEIDARTRRYELGYNGAVELRAFPKTFIGVKAARVDVDFAKDAVFLGTSLHAELTRTGTSAAVSLRYAAHAPDRRHARRRPGTGPLSVFAAARYRFDAGAGRLQVRPVRDSERPRRDRVSRPAAAQRRRAAIQGPDGRRRPVVSRAQRDQAERAGPARRRVFVRHRSTVLRADRNPRLAVAARYGQIFAVGRFGVQRLAYRDRAGAVIEVSNRTDYVHTYGGGLGYRLGNDVRLGLNIDRERRTTAVQGREFDGLRYGMAVTYGQ